MFFRFVIGIVLGILCNNFYGHAIDIEDINVNYLYKNAQHNNLFYNYQNREFYIQKENDKIKIPHSFILPPNSYMQQYFAHAHFYLQDDILRVVLPLMGGGNTPSSIESRKNEGKDLEEKRVLKAARSFGYQPLYLSVFFQEQGAKSAEKILIYRNGMIAGLFEELNTSFEDLNAIVGMTKKEDLSTLQGFIGFMARGPSFTVVAMIDMDSLIDLFVSDNPRMQGVILKRKELRTLYYNACKAYYTDNESSILENNQPIDYYLKEIYTEGFTELKGIISKMRQEDFDEWLNQPLVTAKTIVDKLVRLKSLQVHRETLGFFGL